MTGPNNFIQRLHAALASCSLPPFRIVKSDISIRKGKKKEALLGRFDGVFMYKFTLACIYNFTRLTKGPNLPRSLFLEKNSTKSFCLFDHFAAKYLNRRDIFLKKTVDSIVYQSDLSQREHNFVHGSDPYGKNIYQIPNGVPLEIFRKQPSSSFFSGNPKLVITANFRLVKRLYDAISIINELKKNYPNAVLHVIGPMDQIVKESIAGLNLDACIFHGAVNSNDLPSIYGSMDVGLSPSLFDPCPNSVIEMMACGLPVLTTEASGAAELVPDIRFVIPENIKFGFIESHNCIKIPKVNAIKWCLAIESILETQMDFSQIVIDHAREKFSIDVIAQKYSEVIIKTWDEKS